MSEVRPVESFCQTVLDLCHQHHHHHDEKSTSIWKTKRIYTTSCRYLFKAPVSIHIQEDIHSNKVGWPKGDVERTDCGLGYGTWLRGDSGSNSPRRRGEKTPTSFPLLWNDGSAPCPWSIYDLLCMNAQGGRIGSKQQRLLEWSLIVPFFFLFPFKRTKKQPLFFSFFFSFYHSWVHREQSTSKFSTSIWS